MFHRDASRDCLCRQTWLGTEGSPKECTKGVLCLNCYPKVPTEVRFQMALPTCVDILGKAFSLSALKYKVSGDALIWDKMSSFQCSCKLRGQHAGVFCYPSSMVMANVLMGGIVESLHTRSVRENLASKGPGAPYFRHFRVFEVSSSLSLSSEY